MTSPLSGADQSPSDRISALMSEFSSLRASSAEKRAGFEDARAKAARRGGLGPGWQKLQQRVDLNETTIADIFGGADASPEAQAVLGLSRKNLGALRDDLEADGADPDAENPLEEIQFLSEGIADRLAELRKALER